MRRMFRDIDAECYVIVDGDDTYPAESVREMVDRVFLFSIFKVQMAAKTAGIYTNQLLMKNQRVDEHSLIIESERII